MCPQRTWLWDQAAYTWPVVNVWRDGKPGKTHHARILDADLDAAVSFDPARLIRAGQLDASVRHEATVQKDSTLLLA